MTDHQNKKGSDRKSFRNSFHQWLHSPASVCALMIFGTFIIILGLFFCVCTPRKYDLRVGTISHVTINATKDVEDVVSTEDKRNAAADLVEPSFTYPQGIKEEVLNLIGEAFQELRQIQQYGLGLRTEKDGTVVSNRPFSEEEIEHAQSLLDIITLNRTPLATVLRGDTEEFERMVSTVTEVVENTSNSGLP